MKRLTLYIWTFIQNPKTWILIYNYSLNPSVLLFCNPMLGFIFNQATEDWPLKNHTFILINLAISLQHENLMLSERIILFNEVFEFLKCLFFTIIYCLCAPGEFLGKGFTRKIMLQAPEFKYLLAVKIPWCWILP